MKMKIIYIVLCFAFAVNAQNFFPYKPGDKLQFEIKDSRLEIWYPYNYTVTYSYAKDSIKIYDQNLEYIVFNNQPFRYDTSENKLYILLNNVEKLAVDFNDTVGTSRVLYFPSPWGNTFTTIFNGYENVLGTNRRVYRIQYISAQNDLKQSFAFAEGIGMIADLKAIFWSDKHWVDKNLVSYILDSSVHNQFGLSVTMQPVGCLSPHNFPYLLSVNITTPYKEIVNKLQANVHVIRGVDTIINTMFIGNIAQEKISLNISPLELQTGDKLFVRVLCGDNSIFNNIALYPDSGYYCINISEDCNWSSITYDFFDIVNLKLIDDQRGFIMRQIPPGYMSDPKLRISYSTDGGTIFSDNIYSSLNGMWNKEIFAFGDIVFISNPLLKSTNGGKNFAYCNFTLNIRKIFFLDEANGWLFRLGEKNLYKTSPDAQSIQKITYNPSIDLNSVYFTTELNGYATANSGFYHSTDGGYNWTNINSITGYSEIKIVNSQIFLYGSSGIVKSTDWGNNWTSLYSDNVSDAFFFQTNYAWILSNKKLFFTEDGGTTWTPFLENNNFDAIDFLNVNYGWVYDKTAKLLFRYNGDNPVKVKEDENVQLNPSSFTLMQNYPNPFNPTTTIQYAVSNTQHVQLKVYDVLGNEGSFKQAKKMLLIK